MSDTAQGPDWWQTSDGRWYPPERHPEYSRPSDLSTTPSGVNIPSFEGLNVFEIGQWMDDDFEDTSPLLREYVKELFRCFNIVTEAPRLDLSRVIAKFGGLNNRGNDSERIRAAIYRGLVELEPYREIVIHFLREYPMGPRERYRLPFTPSEAFPAKFLPKTTHRIDGHFMGVTGAVPQNDWDIVELAFLHLQQYINLLERDAYEYGTLLDADYLRACDAIAGEIDSGTGRYRHQKGNVSLQSRKRIAAAFLRSLSFFGSPSVWQQSPGQAARDACFGVMHLRTCLPGGRSQALQVGIETLGAMLNGHERALDAQNAAQWNETFPDSRDRNRWASTGLDLESAREFANYGLSSADFEGFNFNPNHLTQWRERFPDIAARVEWMRTGFDPWLARSCDYAEISPEDVVARCADIEVLQAEWDRAGNREEGAVWAAAGYGPDRASQWFRVEQRYSVARQWMHLGLAPAEAIRWKAVGIGGSEMLQSIEALKWAKMGFSPDLAEHLIRSHMSASNAGRWLEAGILATELVEWLEAGFDPVHMSGADGWVAAGFSLAQVKLWLKAGVSPWAGIGDELTRLLMQNGVSYDKPPGTS